MARPIKRKLIEGIPKYTVFGPIDKRPKDDKVIIMKIEEYETIRLIDFEGLAQQACADIMDVSRTTVQKLYNDARAKVSTSLVLGLKLKISGGDFDIKKRSSG